MVVKNSKSWSMYQISKVFLSVTLITNELPMIIITNLGTLLWIPFADFTGRKIQTNLLDLKGEASTLDLFGTFHNKCNISFPDSQRRQLFFRLNRGKVRSFTRKGLKGHPSSFFGLINKNMKWLTKKKVLHVQLVPNIFKSRQRGFRSQSFRSEYLCHKFKSPLL